MVNARSHLLDLSICAEDLFVEAMAAHTHGPILQAQHSKAVARRLTAMPEVLPVQFMQMLCSNGVKLRLDFAVADQRYGNHKQRPQPEEPTSPIHCSANPRPSGWIINVSSING